ncbi:MAG: hypothetical protein ACRELD_09895 [Longimicrobiales bacterium]
MRHAELIRRLREAALTGPGATDAQLREAVEARAASLGGRAAPETAVPDPLTRFVDQVALHAYRVTEQDIEALRRAGYSEDAIFEIAATAALGAGLGRLERGLAALKGDL